jgi:hypothetical protein
VGACGGCAWSTQGGVPEREWTAIFCVADMVDVCSCKRPGRLCSGAARGARRRCGELWWWEDTFPEGRRGPWSMSMAAEAPRVNHRRNYQHWPSPPPPLRLQLPQLPQLPHRAHSVRDLQNGRARSTDDPPGSRPVVSTAHRRIQYFSADSSAVGGFYSPLPWSWYSHAVEINSSALF